MNTCGARILKAASSFSYRTKVRTRLRVIPELSMEIPIEIIPFSQSKSRENDVCLVFFSLLGTRKNLEILFFKNVSMEA